MEKGGGKRDLGRTNDTLLGVKHVPRKPGFEGGWEINEQVKAMALLVEGRVKNHVGHFGVYGCLKFQRDV